jgi:hypothetical protein
MEESNISPLTRSTGGYYVSAHLDAAPLPAELSVEWLTPRIGADMRFVWEVGDLARSGLRYPLTEKPSEMSDEEIYFSLLIELSGDYVYRVYESIEPFHSTQCECGRELEYEPSAKLYFMSRLPVRCPECKAAFDPGRLAAVVIDGWTGQKRLVSGGATSRFAVVVDCGKAIVHGHSVEAEPALVSLIAECLQCEVEQIGVGH